MLFNYIIFDLIQEVIVQWINHLRIIDGKICIEWDGTERGITAELLELGVIKDDIILGFIRPEYRQFTDFSVA